MPNQFWNPTGQYPGQSSPFGFGGKATPKTNSYPSQMFGKMASSVPNYGQGQQMPSTTQRTSSRFGGGNEGIKAGDYVSKALIGDYLNKVDSTGRMRQDFDKLFGNIEKTGLQAQQGLEMAKQSGKTQMDIATKAKDDMMKQAGMMGDVYKKTQQDVGHALGEARSKMQEAIDKQDFFRKDTVAGGVDAIMGNFNSFKDQVMSGAGEYANYSDADKKAAIDEAHRSMETQRAMYASDADSKAADALASMRMNMGSTMGQLGLSGAGLKAQVGTMNAQMNLAASQEAWRGMQAANQFDAAITQQANAQLIQAQMDNDQMRAGLIKMYPYSAVNMADTILAIMNSQGLKPGSRTTDKFGKEIGGLIGVPNFAGYA